MAALNETYKYIAPAPPADLIDCSNYTINFADRKFINIGIDPTDSFTVRVQIITPSRYVNITPEILTRIFSMMDKILSIILDTPKYKFHLFLETTEYKLSRCVYKKENVLVIESKTVTGCRVILNREDLFTLQNLEWCIFETVARKAAISRPIILQQFEQISRYINKKINKSYSRQDDTTGIHFSIKSMQDEEIVASMPKQDVCYATQIKMFATTQLIECWQKSTDNLLNTSHLPPSYSPISPPPPPSQLSTDYSMMFSNYLPLVKEERAFDECGIYKPQYIKSPLSSSDEEEMDSAVSEMGWGLKRRFSS